MKNILVAVMALVVFPLTFALKANGQTISVSTETVISTEPVIAELAKITPLVKMDKNEAPVKKLVELPAVNDLFKLSLRPYASAGYVDMKSMNFAKENKDGDLGMSGSTGYSLKIGAEVLPILDVGAEYLNMGTFGWDEDRLSKSSTRIQIHDEMSFSITAKMLNVNLKYPLKVKGVKITPFITAGTGRARMKIRYVTDIPSLKLHYDDKYRDDSPCYKVGAGVKVEALKNLSVYGEFIHFHSKFSNKETEVLQGRVVNNGLAIGLELKY